MFGMGEETKRRRRPLYVLPIALLMHLVGLVTIVSAQYWNVGTVAEPQQNILFVDLTVPQIPNEPPPQKPKLPAAQPPQNTKAATVQPPTPVRTVSQPQVVPDNLPRNDGPKDDTPEVPGLPQNGPFDPNAPPGPPGPPGPGPGPGPGDNDAKPLYVGGLVTPPQRIEATAVKPQYTEMARRARLSGIVVAEAIIDEHGDVTNIRILKPLPMGLDHAAIEAMARWKFRPATLGGKPVKVYYNLQVNFQVQ